MKKVMFCLFTIALTLSAVSLAWAQKSPTSNVAVSQKCKSQGNPIDVTVSSKSGQGTGVSAGNDSNYVDGGNSTSAKGNGSIKADSSGNPKGSSDATSKGKTTATLSSTPDSNSAQITSKGKSAATVQLDGNGQKKSNAVAKGSGRIDAGSSLGGGPKDNFSAGASISGTSAYSARGPNAAAGSTTLNGSTSATRTTTPTGETISSTAKECSSSKASGH